MPDFSAVRFHPKLLVRAAQYWMVSDSALPPTLDEILMRDMVFDDAVYTMRQAMEYFMDEPLRRAANLV